MKKKQLLEPTFPKFKSQSGIPLRAGGSCRGICIRYKIKFNPKKSMYDLGKFCSYCGVFLQVNGISCFCCGKRLRHHRRHHNVNSRHKKGGFEGN